MFGDLMNLEGNLWNEFQRLQRELDTLFTPGVGRANIRSVAGGTFPAVNVGATADGVQVYVFAPGIDTDTLDVSIQRNLLTISGERPIQRPSTGNGYHLRERFEGGFRRVIGLPDDVDPDKVDASYRDGILTVTVGKREAAKPRQIKISNA